jgi:hypothetical protein
VLRPNPPGVLLDAAIESNFAKNRAEALRAGRIPYRAPWIGFSHVPPGVPPWFTPAKDPQAIFQQPAWQESLPHCRGLFALSRAHADFLRARFPGLPVAALLHPTGPPDLTFRFEDYLRQGQPVVQVGWWLRRLASIHLLPLSARRKRLLIPHAPGQLDRFWAALEAERTAAGAPPLREWQAAVLPRLPNEAYDELLAHSLVFLHLHGASANNAIVECIVRRTPVLVNPLPAVREYLGAAYPLYFETLDEAAAKASDPDLVLAAHRYLASVDPEPFSASAFLRAFAASEPYRALAAEAPLEAPAAPA